MDPAALREKLAELDAEGARIKFLYLIPNFQNPSGVTLSEERRREIVAIARDRELLIVEDNPYSLLRYEGEPIPSLLEIDGGESVIYVGTFSKILSPGIRLGWITAPRPVLDKFNLAKQGADLCSSSLSQHFVTAYLNSGHWPDYMTSLRRIYRTRRNAMLESLESEMPEGTTWTQPTGGLFIWATLPDYIDTTDLLARALRENVAFVPGRAAWTNGEGSSSMRLNFSGVDENRIREGISRIAGVAREQVDLYETMMGKPTPAPNTALPEADGAKVVPLPTRRAAGENR
jgi:2-aminoadipate transaminase